MLTFAQDCRISIHPIAFSVIEMQMCTPITGVKTIHRSSLWEKDIVSTNCWTGLRRSGYWPSCLNRWAIVPVILASTWCIESNPCPEIYREYSLVPDKLNYCITVQPS
jgi:hypothetical protein